MDLLCHALPHPVDGLVLQSLHLLGKWGKNRLGSIKFLGLLPMVPTTIFLEFIKTEVKIKNASFKFCFILLLLFLERDFVKEDNLSKSNFLKIKLYPQIFTIQSLHFLSDTLISSESNTIFFCIKPFNNIHESKIYIQIFQKTFLIKWI